MISIIVPLYNYEKYVGYLLESVSAQTYGDFECIVVDDASTDNSCDVVLMHMKNDPRIILSRRYKNSGYSACKNRGIRMSKGKFIVHIDADDMLTPNSLQYRYNTFIEKPELQVVWGRALEFRGAYSYAWCIDNMANLTPDKARLHAQTVMLRREVFEDHGFYYEPLRSRADKEYWMRIGLYPGSDKHPVINDNKIPAKKLGAFVAFYRRHEDSMKSKRKKDKKVNGEINKLFNARIKELKHGFSKKKD